MNDNVKSGHISKDKIVYVGSLNLLEPYGSVQACKDIASSRKMSSSTHRSCE